MIRLDHRPGGVVSVQVLLASKHELARLEEVCGIARMRAFVRLLQLASVPQEKSHPKRCARCKEEEELDETGTVHREHRFAFVELKGRFSRAWRPQSRVHCYIYGQ